MPLSAPRGASSTTAAVGGGYSGLGIIAAVREEQGDIRGFFENIWRHSQKIRDRRLIRVGGARVPLGSRVLPILEPSYVISEVPTAVVWAEETPLSEPGTWKNPPSLQTELPVLIVSDWGEWYAAKEAGQHVSLQREGVDHEIVWNPDTQTETKVMLPTSTVSEPVIVNTTETSSMDLGSILNTGLDLWGKYETIQSTRNQPVSYQQPVYSLPEMGGDIVDFFTDPKTGTIVPVKKKKPCRRRRKRLATKSDLGDLAALKAILGNGEAFKAWIATHSR